MRSFHGKGWKGQRRVKGKRVRGTDKHHLTPQSRGGSNQKSNLLRIDITRHRNWHLVFGNRTLDEVIALLHRVKRAKEGQRVRLPKDVLRFVMKAQRATG